MATLLLCETCTRYFRTGEVACPFCATVPTRTVRPRPIAVPTGTSRGRIYAAKLAALASAATFVACTDDGEQGAAVRDPSEGDDVSLSGGESGNGPATEENPDANQGDSPSNPANGAGDTSPSGGPSATNPTNSETPTSGLGGAGQGAGSGGSAGNGVAAAGAGSGGADTVGPDGMMTSDAGTTDAGPNMTTDVLGQGGMACPGYEEVNPDTNTCSVQADCTGNTVCSTVTVYDDTPVGPNCNVIGFSYCDPEVCFGVCVPEPNGCGSTCAEDCNPETCTGTQECVDNVCVSKPCDAEGAADCGTSYVCEPGAESANQLGCRLLKCQEPNGIECGELYRCAEAGEEGDYRGCVRVLCDEPNGPACRELSACRPEAEGAGPDGCVELDCSEAGGPTCNEGLVCRPDSVHALGGNQKGCARLQCDEGGDACVETQLCLPDRADANVLGCVTKTCDLGWACDAFRDCNVSAIGAGADAHGCVDRACTVDTDCDCGYCVREFCRPIQGTCRVPEIVANPYGCVWPDDEFV